MIAVNEIFYSIQGEGANSGRPAVFVRLAGCNLKCHFCDTDFSSKKLMKESDILEEIVKIAPKCRFIVITGGEPLLQNLLKLTQLLFKNGYCTAVETNGTIKKPTSWPISWLTVSPKEVPLIQDYGDELKVIYQQQDLSVYPTQNFRKCYLQPVFTSDERQTQQNIQRTVEAVKENPKWRLSLQSHKLIGIQ